MIFRTIYSNLHVNIQFIEYTIPNIYEYSTKGSICPLTLFLRSQPLGREISSWYSAGSQRVKGVLADPQRVFCLSKEKKNPLLTFSLSCSWVQQVHYVTIFDSTISSSKGMLPQPTLQNAESESQEEKVCEDISSAQGPKHVSSQLVVNVCHLFIFLG